jgi:hypothetical protein
MADILSQLRALDSKRAALDATIRQTQSRVRSSTAHDDRTTKRHAEDIAASGTPAVASSITVANAAASDSRRLSSPREKQVICCSILVLICCSVVFLLPLQRLAVMNRELLRFFL